MCSNAGLSSKETSTVCLPPSAPRKRRRGTGSKPGTLLQRAGGDEAGLRSLHVPPVYCALVAVAMACRSCGGGRMRGRDAVEGMVR